MTASPGDRLLWAVTANRRVSSRAFTSLFDQFVAPQIDMDESAVPIRRRVTSWLLDALGHCETLIGERKSDLEPSTPCLSRLPVSGFPRAMLTGGRQPGTREELETAATKLGGVVSVDSAEHRLGVLPDRIEVETELPDTLEAIAHELGIAWQSTPAAWVLSNVSAGLDDTLNTLHFEPVQDLNWRRRYFDPIALRLRDEPVVGDAVLIRHEHPYSRRLHFELRRADRAAAIDGDWGRYAILRETHRDVLVYDARRYLFAVLWGAPLPRLLRRALTCCSGRPPASMPPRKGAVEALSATGADVYVGVVPDIASQVSRRIGQRLIGGNLSQIGD